MKLFIGLGNPGTKYENTRHNIGFMALDYYTQNLNEKFKLNTKLQCELLEYNNLGKKAVFIKPNTFMNLSGDALIKVMNYFNIEVEDVIIIFDDLDTDTGKVKIKQKGSSGGHNGLKDIFRKVGTEKVKRIKIGISRSKTISVTDYVLGNFSKEEKKEIDESLIKVDKIIEDFINGIDIIDLMNKYN